MYTCIPHYRFSVAPMMDWTDRHCRYFHRQFSKHMLLYTEMITAAALIHGDSAKLLRHSECEHPLALQLGGSDPEMLAKAVKIAEPYGFCEINLNVGCPSDRVQSGRFGACLMKEPQLVAECVEVMQDARKTNTTEITVKCRIGVDEQVPEEILPDFLHKVARVGCKRFIIHARKAWLKGLSPKENRMIPPLNYNLVYQIKQQNPDLFIILNGGLDSWEVVDSALEHVDGVMVGRDAYHKPSNLLSSVDNRVFQSSQDDDLFLIAHTMIPYIEQELSLGTPLHHITRHMLGLFSGLPGARLWRQMLSQGRSVQFEDYMSALETVLKNTAFKKKHV